MTDLLGDVRYYFLQGDSYDYFNLHQDTGKVTTAQKLLVNFKYSMHGLAEDKGGTKETST